MVVASITVLSYSNSYDLFLPVVFLVDIDDDNYSDALLFVSILPIVQRKLHPTSHPEVCGSRVVQNS